MKQKKQKKLRERRDVKTKALIMPEYCLGEMKQNGDDLGVISNISIASLLKFVFRFKRFWEKNI